MRHLIIGIALLLLQQASAQSLAHTREARIGKGANLSNWLEAYWLGTAWPQAAKYQKQDLQAMQTAGLSTIRLPFCFERITDTLPPYTVDFNAPAIAWLDSVIAWTSALQMNLIIDNQHNWNLTNDNFNATIPRMASMWRQVSTHYASLDPEHYFFEMLNEPPVGLLPANADAVNRACIDSVRSHDQQHTLIVGPHTASIGSSFATFSPYPDTNLIYTFHTYEPLYFTHQGFTWSTPQFPTGTPFPFLGDDALVTSSIDAVANWRATYGLPVFMGEFGVGIHADSISRCNWINHLGNLITNRGFNALAWDWGGVQPSDFSMFNGLPATASQIIPCFASAWGLFGFTAINAPTSNEHKIRCYPNPTDHVLNIENLGIAYEHAVWIDPWGHVIGHEALTTNTTQQLSLDALPKGLLLLRLTATDGSQAHFKVLHL